MVYPLPLQSCVLLLLSSAADQKALPIPKASLTTISGLLSSHSDKAVVMSGLFPQCFCCAVVQRKQCKYSPAVLASYLNMLLFGFQIQTQMILILLPLKASMTPWILIVYLKRHSGACVGNMHHA